MIYERWPVVLIVVAVVLAAACGGAGGEETPEVEKDAALEDTPPEQTEAAAIVDSAAESTELSDTEWTLKSVHGESPLQGTRITLEIGKKELGTYAGCNGWGGRYEATDEGGLEVGGLGGTLMGCEDEVLRQENTYLRTLKNAVAYRIRDGDLLLLGSDADTALVYAKKPGWSSDPDALVGTEWMLASTNGMPPPEASTPTISFDSESRFSGYDGCVEISGSYTVSRDDFAITGSRVEGAATCMKSEAISAEANNLPEASMGMAGDYRLSDERLEISTDAGDAFVFVPLPAEGVEKGPGVGWELEKFKERGEETPVLEGTRITFRFDGGVQREKGVMSGSASCNDYVADYSYLNWFDNGTPSLRSVGKKACLTPPGVMEQERRFLSLLEKMDYASTTIDGKLELGTKSWDRKMIFAARE